MQILPIHILSHGLGVQTTAIDFMADAGIITPRPDARVFADTKDEPLAVEKWKEYLKTHSTIPFVEVSKGNLMEDALQVKRSGKSGKLYIKGLIPAFVLNADGSKGLLGRKCTPDYKIAMILRHARKMIGKEAFKIWRAKHKTALREISAYNVRMRAYKKADKEEKKRLLAFLNRPDAAFDECKNDALCIMWIGISTDEIDRKKESEEPWIKTRWPLEELDMTRDDCVNWVVSRGHPEPPRSACKKCPFHSDDEWIRQRDESPSEFAESVAWERRLQEAARSQEQLKGIPYLHDSCVPLDQVKFIPATPGYKQVDLFKNECTGLCNV